jgi:hypothetical protein
MGEKKGTLVVTSGISHCGGKSDFLPGFSRLCQKHGKKVKIYNTGEMIPEWVRDNAGVELAEDTILDVDPLAMEIAQGGVWQYIVSRLGQALSRNDVVIINIHTVFYWRRIFETVNNHLFLRKMIDAGFRPDLFVCFIDNAVNILNRLNQSKQWSGQQLGENDVWRWQNIEVDNTKTFIWAYYPPGAKRKFFVMPVRQPPETFYHIIFNPLMPLVYSQTPITHLEPHELEDYKNFVSELRKWAVVFDPLTIETGIIEKVTGSADNLDKHVRHYQTVHRDLMWFIPQVEICAALITKHVFTAGVVDETVTASRNGKHTWVAFPGGYSPFLLYRSTENRVFQTAGELLEYMVNVYLKPIYEKAGVPLNPWE